MSKTVIISNIDSFKEDELLRFIRKNTSINIDHIECALRIECGSRFLRIAYLTCDSEYNATRICSDINGKLFGKCILQSKTVDIINDDHGIVLCSNDPSISSNNIVNNNVNNSIRRPVRALPSAIQKPILPQSLQKLPITNNVSQVTQPPNSLNNSFVNQQKDTNSPYNNQQINHQTLKNSNQAQTKSSQVPLISNQMQSNSTHSWNNNVQVSNVRQEMNIPSHFRNKPEVSSHSNLLNPTEVLSNRHNSQIIESSKSENRSRHHSEHRSHHRSSHQPDTHSSRSTESRSDPKSSHVSNQRHVSPSNNLSFVDNTVRIPLPYPNPITNANSHENPSSKSHHQSRHHVSSRRSHHRHHRSYSPSYSSSYDSYSDEGYRHSKHHRSHHSQSHRSSRREKEQIH